MVANLYPPPRPLSVGETIDLAFRIFRATLVTCLLLAGLAVIAGQLPNIYLLLTGHPLVSILEQRDPRYWLLDVAGNLLLMMLISAIVLRQYAVVAAAGAAVGTELGTIARRLPALVLLWILYVAAIAIWFLPAYLLRASPVSAVLLALLMSLPATYVAIAVSCCWQVFLLSGRGAVRSIAYSWRLTRGHWWRLSAIYTVGAMLLVVLYVLAGVLALAIALPLSRDLATTTAASTVIVVILSAIGTPFYTALALAVYGDLTARREGADLAQRIAAA